MPQNFFKDNECEYLDYKSEYHANKAKLLHDILCLSNAYTKLSRKIIFGVSDNLKEFPGIAGDKNRLNQANLIDWARKIKFNNIPELSLETKIINNLEFDIIVIENKPLKPYFLTEPYPRDKITIPRYAIFTRDKDVNTPIDSCASDKQIEKMYLERAGILDEHLRLTKVVLHEASFNKTPSVGDVKCPFLLDGHFKFLSSPLVRNIPVIIINLIEKIFREGKLCNGGKTKAPVLPGNVKKNSSLLHELLSKYYEEL